MNTMHPRDQDQALDKDDGDQGAAADTDPRRTGIQADEGEEQQAADPNIINK